MTIIKKKSEENNWQMLKMKMNFKMKVKKRLKWPE